MSLSRSTNPVSKPTAAQYLAEKLQREMKSGRFTPERLRALLPPYLVEAIVHVTEPFDQAAGSRAQVDGFLGRS